MRLWRFAARLGAGLAGLAVAGTAWAAFAPAASALSSIQTGYWSSLPAAPQVPSGGFEVGSNPSGAHAVAAVRFTLADGESVQTLTLKVQQAEPADQVAIQACPTAARSMSWQPPSGGGPGTLSDAPTPDCSGGLATGNLSSDGSTMTFDLSLTHFAGPTIDIVLSPNQVATPAGGTVPQIPTQTFPTFDAAFQQVTSAQIAVVSAPLAAQPPSTADGSSAGSPAVAPAPAPAAGAVNLPPSTTTADSAGAAPVLAPVQPANAAQALPSLVTKKRNLRLLLALAMLSSDLMFGLLWVQKHLPDGDRRPHLSIYDPPPVTGT
jgi:hypothetical protein